MDVRYGSGAFMDDMSEAKILGNKLQELLSDEGISTFYTLTDTSEPTGSSIGNAIEVVESIAAMGGGGAHCWDLRSIIYQRDLVILFFAKLMHSEFAFKSEAEWASFAREQFANGSILKSFGNILSVHGVSASFVEKLLCDPMQSLCIHNIYVDILSPSTGQLTNINQRKLGDIIYNGLNAARINLNGQFDTALV